MKCKNKNCGGNLLTTNTFYDEEGTAYRRRMCNKCKMVAFTAESETVNSKFYVAMSNYYKQRRKSQEGDK